MLLVALTLAAPKVWLNGRLVDSAGQPLPGQYVHLMPLDKPDRPDTASG